MTVLSGTFIWDGFPRNVVGKRFAPNLPGRTETSISFRVVGFSADAIRVETASKRRSELALSLFRDAIADGTLILID